MRHWAATNARREGSTRADKGGPFTPPPLAPALTSAEMAPSARSGAMAKGQMRGNKEAKKPKKEQTKLTGPAKAGQQPTAKK
jgi:hypothetical protein